MSSIGPWVFGSRGSKRWSIILLLLGICLAGFGTFVVHRRDLKRDKNYTSSCANHAIQLRSLVAKFLDRGADFPAGSDARTAFMQMALPGEFPASWFTSYGSSCPESFMRDGSIGYVYVAEGLSVGMVKTNDALVFFCPATSHQRSAQHSHAIKGEMGMGCVDDNASMIQVLEGELDRGRRGVVPYSARSIARIEIELDTRRRMEADR